MRYLLFILLLFPVCAHAQQQTIDVTNSADAKELSKLGSQLGFGHMLGCISNTLTHVQKSYHLTDQQIQAYQMKPENMKAVEKFCACHADAKKFYDAAQAIIARNPSWRGNILKFELPGLPEGKPGIGSIDLKTFDEMKKQCRW